MVTGDEVFGHAFPVVVVLTVVGVAGVVGVVEGLVVSEADECFELPASALPGLPYVSVGEACTPPFALPSVFGVEAEVVEVGMSVGREVVAGVVGGLREVAACLDAAVEHLQVVVALVVAPPGEGVVGEQGPAVAGQITLKPYVEHGGRIVEHVGAYVEHGSALHLDVEGKLGQLLRALLGQLHGVRQCGHGKVGEGIEVDDAEHRVTYAGIVGLQQVAVYGQLLHAPFLGAYADAGVVDDGEDTLDGAALHLLVVDDVLAQALPRLTVGMHEEAVAQFGMTLLDGTAHGGGTAARELDVVLIHTFR